MKDTLDYQITFKSPEPDEEEESSSSDPDDGGKVGSG